jgi:hypothetical protein
MWLSLVAHGVAMMWTVFGQFQGTTGRIGFRTNLRVKRSPLSTLLGHVDTVLVPGEEILCQCFLLFSYFPHRWMRKANTGMSLQRLTK